MKRSPQEGLSPPGTEQNQISLPGSPLKPTQRRSETPTQLPPEAQIQQIVRNKFFSFSSQANNSTLAQRVAPSPNLELLAKVDFKKLLQAGHGTRVFYGQLPQAGQKPLDVVVKFDSTQLGPIERQAMTWLNQFQNQVPVVPLLFGGAENLPELGGNSTYMVSPYYPHGDLFTIMENKQAPFNLNATRLIAYQLLRYLAFLETKGKIHGDIKPENIFWDQDVETIRVGDVSMMSDTRNKTQENSLYCFGSRPYFSPEIILNTGNFKKTDVWSAGITLFGLLTGEALFYTSDADNPIMSQRDLLYQMIELLGPVPANLQAQADPKKIGTEESQLGAILKADGTYNWEINPDAFVQAALGNLPDRIGEVAKDKGFDTLDLSLFIDLLKKMLTWPPSRITATEALNHQFFTPLFKK